MKKKLSKKIITSLLISMAGLSFAAFAVYAAGVVFFGSASAQTVVSFTTVGTTSWTVPDGITSVEVLVVAGGGGTGYDVGGGGGGGGVVYHSTKAVTPGQSYTVTVGGGGSSGQTSTVKGGNGGNSVFSDMTAIGGGGGGSYPGNGVGLSGGSGGGGGDANSLGGAATQGNSGGGTGYGYVGGRSNGAWGGGGGGGAGGPGQNGIIGQVVNGGQGYISSISGSSVEYGKGGKGNSDGGVVNSTPANVGQGAMGTGSPNNSPYSGGSGIVIIRYGKSKMAVSSIEKGLVGHWALDGDGYNASTGRVTDKTPYENHGTNNGATLTTDQKGQTNGAMSFDGGSYIDLGSSSQFNIAKNISSFAWIKLDTTSDWDGIFGNHSGGGFVHFQAIGTGLNVYLYGPNATYSNTEAALNPNTWYHVGFTYDGNTLRVYKNGEQLPTTGTAASPASNISNVSTVGVGRVYSSDRYFNGSIDDVRVYNRALSATEVATLYGAYKPKVTTGSLQQGLVLDMPLTSNYTKTVTAGSEIMTDRTPYSHDGQNYGATVGSNSTSFNGVNDYIRTPPISLNVFTIGAWVNPGATQNGEASIISDVYPNKVNYKIGFVAGTLNITGGIYLGGWYDTPAVLLTPNVWQHVVFSYNGAAMAIYLDGVLKGSTNISITPSSSGTGLNIGRRWDINDCFNGSMSAVKIYNRALSAQEIESLYVQGATNLGGVKTHRASCKAILDAGESTGDGFYTIKPNSGGLSFRAYCDMTTDGGGWTLVLLNNKGLTSPAPAWDSAINDVNTTGSLNSDLTSFDLFLGVSYWKNLGSKMRLQIGSSPSSLTNKAIYSGFSFAGNYALTMSGETIVVGSGSPGMYTYHAANNFGLTTSDRDNDTNSGNCSAYYGNAPWWYGSCWSGSFWGYTTAEGPRWTDAGAGESQWGSIWIGQ